MAARRPSSENGVILATTRSFDWFFHWFRFGSLIKTATSGDTGEKDVLRHTEAVIWLKKYGNLLGLAAV